MKTKIFGSALVALLLIGCGSDDSTITSPNPTPALDRNGNGYSNGDINSSLKVGYFLDATVSGAKYSTNSELEGVTDKYGRFQYKDGDSVRFSIGNLILGDATPEQDGLVTPKSLAQGNEELKVLLLRVLQSLDSDNNLSNGIRIPSNVIASLSGINQTSITEVDSEAKLLDIDKELALAIDKDFDGTIDTNHTEAMKHFEDSSTDWEHGNRPTGEWGNGNQTEDCNSSVNINNSPLSKLTPELKNAIAYMGNEERLAYDVYQNLYNYHNSENAIIINQLKNISEKSEIKHVGIVQDIVKKYALTPDELTNVIDPVATSDIAFDDMPSGRYDIPAIQGLYDVLYAKGVGSQKDALEVGCMVEVTDIDDLDRYITMAKESNATDIIDAFNLLRDGSYSHYWAFDNGLKNIGLANGCCSLGTLNGVNYCHTEYRKNEHNGDSSDGTGHGNGNGQ